MEGGTLTLCSYLPGDNQDCALCGLPANLHKVVVASGDANREDDETTPAADEEDDGGDAGDDGAENGSVVGSAVGTGRGEDRRKKKRKKKKKKRRRKADDATERSGPAGELGGDGGQDLQKAEQGLAAATLDAAAEAERPRLESLEPQLGVEEGGETVLLRGRNFSDPRRVGRSRCWARFGTLIVPVEFVGNGTVKITTPPRPWDAVPYMDGGRRYANVYVKVTFDGGVMYSREALPFRYRVGESVATSEGAHSLVYHWGNLPPIKYSKKVSADQFLGEPSIPPHLSNVETVSYPEAEKFAVGRFAEVHQVALSNEYALVLLGDGRLCMRPYGPKRRKFPVKPVEEDLTVPVPVAPGTVRPVGMVACGSEHYAIATSPQAGAELFTCGSNSKGQLGTGKGSSSKALTRVEPIVSPSFRTTYVACGAEHTMATTLTREGITVLWSWGAGWSSGLSTPAAEVNLRSGICGVPHGPGDSKKPVATLYFAPQGLQWNKAWGAKPHRLWDRELHAHISTQAMRSDKEDRGRRERMERGGWSWPTQARLRFDQELAALDGLVYTMRGQVEMKQALIADLYNMNYIPPPSAHEAEVDVALRELNGFLGTLARAERDWERAHADVLADIGKCLKEVEAAKKKREALNARLEEALSHVSESESDAEDYGSDVDPGRVLSFTSDKSAKSGGSRGRSLWRNAASRMRSSKNSRALSAASLGSDGGDSQGEESERGMSKRRNLRSRLISRDSMGSHDSVSTDGERSAAKLSKRRLRRLGSADKLGDAAEGKGKGQGAAARGLWSMFRRRVKKGADGADKGAHSSGEEEQPTSSLRRRRRSSQFSAESGASRARDRSPDDQGRTASRLRTGSDLDSAASVGSATARRLKARRASLKQLKIDSPSRSGSLSPGPVRRRSGLGSLSPGLSPRSGSGSDGDEQSGQGARLESQASLKQGGKAPAAGKKESPKGSKRLKLDWMGAIKLLKKKKGEKEEEEKEKEAEATERVRSGMGTANTGAAGQPMEEEFAAVDQDLRDLTVRLSSLQQRQQSVEGRLADLSDQRRLLQQLEDDWKEAEDKEFEARLEALGLSGGSSMLSLHLFTLEEVWEDLRNRDVDNVADIHMRLQRSVQGKIDAVLTDMEDVGELDDLPDEVALTLGGLGVRYVRTLQKEYKEFLLNKAASAEDEENESKRMVFRPFQLEGDPMDQELRYGRRLRHEGMITERTRASEALLRSAMEKDAARLWRYDQSGARRIFTPDGERLGDRPQWQYDVAVPYAGLTDREVAMATEVGTRELLTESNEGVQGTLEAIEDMEFDGPTAATARMFAVIVKDTATLRLRMNDLMEHKVLDCEQRVTQETQELISALDEEVEEREGEEEDRPGKKVSPHAPLTALKVCIADTEVKKEGEEGEEE